MSHAPLPYVRPTPRISCEAVPPPVWPAGAQGGTSACHTGAALSFVSCIRLFGGSPLPFAPLASLTANLGDSRLDQLANECGG